MVTSLTRHPNITHLFFHALTKQLVKLFITVRIMQNVNMIMIASQFNMSKHAFFFLSQYNLFSFFDLHDIKNTEVLNLTESVCIYGLHKRHFQRG